MSLRRNLIGLAGTLMLAVSPTAIVLAQDAQAPTVEAPASGKPSVEDVLKRHKKHGSQDGEGAPAGQQAAPDTSQGQDGAPAKPRPPKPAKPAAAQDGTNAAPAANEGENGAPAMKLKRQKPGSAQPAPDQAAPTQAAPNQEAPNQEAPNQEAPNQEAPNQEAPAASPPAAKPKADTKQPDAKQPDTKQPDMKQPDPGTPDGAQPEIKKPGRQKPPVAAEPSAPAQTEDQQNGAAKPPRQRPQPPTDDGQQGAAPGGAPVPPAPTDQQGNGQGKRRDRGNNPNQPSGGQQNAMPGDNGQQQDQGRPGGWNRPSGQGNNPGQYQQPDDGMPQNQGQDGWNRPNGQGNNPGQYQQQGRGQGRFLPGPINRAAEQRAIGLLADNAPPERMNDQQLRQRLNVYRSVLAAGNLSEATEQALIQRLNATRAALRNRVADQEDTQQNGQPGRNSQFGRPQFQQGSPRPQDIPAILADRRPSSVLTVDQLNRRILVYRDATNDQRYGPDDREAFNQYLQDDRGELRRRLLNDRGQRYDRMRRPDGGQRLDLDIVPRRQRSQSVWAAEVDDDQIEEQFAARPLRPLPRRFPRADFFAQPEMVMEQPFVRQSIPSVELDTIHFGFNESFIREEEIANLDRIGRIIERIVTAHPNEVFVIEGNTDAVGDDAYNLRLSKDRAEAVKQALTQYYVISPNNLVTAGLGERYLKIPTPEPEQENRRVTLRRVTSLLQN